MYLPNCFVIMYQAYCRVVYVAFSGTYWRAFVVFVLWWLRGITLGFSGTPSFFVLYHWFRGVVIDLFIFLHSDIAYLHPSCSYIMYACLCYVVFCICIAHFVCV